MPRRSRQSGLPVVDEVHLVDGEDDVLDAHQGDDRAMPVGLPQQTLGRVDQDHRQIGGGCAGRHVARVLLMPRRVGDDESRRGVEKKRYATSIVMPCSRSACRPSTSKARSGVADGAYGDRRGSRPSDGLPGRPWRRTSRRPIKVLLPSSTLPQVMNRSMSSPAGRGARVSPIRNSPRASCAPSSRRHRDRSSDPGAPRSGCRPARR